MPSSASDGGSPSHTTLTTGLKKRPASNSVAAPAPTTGWVPLKQLSDQDMDREINQTLANLLPFRAPPLNPNRVLVDTRAGLREGHGAQDHVVRDFDSRFKKTSNGNPLFTSGVFIKPPTLPEDREDPARKERIAAEKEEEFKQRQLAGPLEAAEKEAGHHASELAQFTFNKFDLTRKAAGKDKTNEIQSLKGVDPSRIQQLLAHNIRSNAPERLQVPDSATKRSTVKDCKKKARPLDAEPNQVLPSSPVLHYLSIPGQEDPIAPYSMLADRLDDTYEPLAFVELAKGNAGDKETEAPLVLNPSPPETHLHVPGKEQSYFSVPATPPTLSLAAPRELPQEKVARATQKQKDARPTPLAPSTPPEASFFVPHREIPAMPQTHEPKTAGFGSFVATPVQERIELDKIGRHKGGDANAIAPAMLLPRTPAELTFDAPPGSELAKKLGNDKNAQRPDMFSVPAVTPIQYGKQEQLVSKKEAQLGPRPKPVLPRTPAETTITLPQRDDSGAQLPPAGQFFSVPATPPTTMIEQKPAPAIIRSKRKQQDDEKQQEKDNAEKVEEALREAEEESRRNGEGPLSPDKITEKRLEVQKSIQRNQPRKKTDFGADDAPVVPLPPTPPETKIHIPGKSQFTVTNTLTNSVSHSADRSRGTEQPQQVQVLTNVFGTPATPPDKPVQPDFVDLHQKNPEPKDPKPVLPPTPLEHSINLPGRDREKGEHDQTLEAFKFSVPPTPPAAPIVVLPAPKKKVAKEGEPSENKTLLPPSPVDPKLEPLPPTRGIDMESEVKNAKKAQVFSMPATPPTMQLPQVTKIVPKTLREDDEDPELDRELQKEEEERKKRLQQKQEEEGEGDGESTARADSESSDIPPFLRAKMKEIKAKERQEKREEKKIADGKEGAKPVIPHTPPETSYTLPPPPKFTIQRASSRSGSNASSVFSSVPGGGASTTSELRSGSQASSVLSKTNSIVIQRGGGKKLPSKAPSAAKEGEGEEKTETVGDGKHGEFFSIPSTPPDSKYIKPQYSIVRKQPQSDKRDVMDAKPVIPSTPPDDFFIIPKKKEEQREQVLHLSPSPGRGGGLKERQKVLEETKFFSIAPTPVTKPLPSDHISRHQDPTSSFALDDNIPLENAAKKSSTADAVSGQPPKLPTPQELSWGVEGIPDSKPKQGFDPAKDAKARELRAKEIEEYNLSQRQERDRIQKLRLERQIERAEAESKRIEAEALNAKRELSPDEAAIKIQSIQRQRQARAQLRQLREKKERDELLKENSSETTKLETELEQIRKEKKQLDEKVQSGKKLTTAEESSLIELEQRERMAQRELDKIQKESTREKEEAKNEDEQAAMEEELKRLERQQKELEAKAKSEKRELSPDEAALRIQCKQRQRMAKKRLTAMKQKEVERQKQAAEEAAKETKKIDQDIEELSSKLRDVQGSLQELEITAKSRHLTSEESQKQDSLKKRQEVLQEELEQLQRDQIVAKEEQEALAAEAKATELETKLDSARDELSDKKQQLADLKRKVAKQEQPTEEQQKKMKELQDEIASLEKKTDKLEDDHGAAVEAHRKEEAEAQAAQADEKVNKLEDELKNLEEEQRKIDERAKQEGRELTPDEAARKIQCMQRKRMAKKELSKRKKQAETKEKEIAKAKLQAELGELKRQEEDFLQQEASGTPLSAEQQRIREQSMLRRREIRSEIAVLNYVTLEIQPGVSSPATPPEQQHHPTDATATSPYHSTGTYNLVPSHASPSSTAIASTNTAGPLPPTPPEETHGLPIESAASVRSLQQGGASSSSVQVQQIPFADSQPSDPLPTQPRRPNAQKHSGSDHPEVKDVLPPTPPEDQYDISPARNFDDAVAREEAALKIQSAQRQRRARHELARLQTEKAEAEAAKAREEEEEAEAKLKALEEEQKRLEEASKHRQLTEEESARKIQCLQRQRMARKELERRRQAALMKQKEADAAAAAEQEANAEQKLKDLEEEQRRIEEQAKKEGRELTPDEAARKIQCLQRQRLARRELNRRKDAAATKEAEASAARARNEEAEAQRQLQDLEEEQRKLDEAAKGRELTPDEAARRIQCMQRQRMARKELEARRAAKAEKERRAAEAARLANMPVAGVHPHQQAPQIIPPSSDADNRSNNNNFSNSNRFDYANNNNDDDDSDDPTARANRLAAQAVRDAARESDRRFLHTGDNDNNNNNNTYSGGNTSSPATSRVYIPNTNRPDAIEDDRQSLPGLGNNNSAARGNQDASSNTRYNNDNNDDSRASSNINGPSRYQPTSSTSAINFRSNDNNHNISFTPQQNNNNNNRGTNNNNAMPSPIPVIIRRSSNGSSTTSTPAQHSLHHQQHDNTTSTASRILQESGVSNVDRSRVNGRTFAVEESPAPRPVEPGHVVRNVADAMPHAPTLQQFASQLEVYFSTFDPSQMGSIASIAPAYRNRQRDLWNFLRDRYELDSGSAQQQQTNILESPVASSESLATNNNNNNNDNNIINRHSPSPSIRIPRSAATPTAAQQQPHRQLPQITPAMQRVIQQHHSNAAIHNTTNNQNNTTLLSNNIVRASQIPSATSSRIFFSGAPANTSATSSVVNNNTSSSTFGRPTTPVVIRRGNTAATTGTQGQNDTNSNTNTSSVISEEIVTSDQRPSSLVEDLALSEIMRMLREQEQRR